MPVGSGYTSDNKEQRYVACSTYREVRHVLVEIQEACHDVLSRFAKCSKSFALLFDGLKKGAHRPTLTISGFRTCIIGS